MATRMLDLLKYYSRLTFESRLSSITENARHEKALALYKRGRPLDDVIDGEAQLLHDPAPRRGGAEAVDADHVAAVADVAMPALRRARLHGEPAPDRRRQDRIAVVFRPGVEELPARHRDDARADVFLRELLPGRDD